MAMKLSQSGIESLKLLETGGKYMKTWVKDAHGYSIGYGHFRLPGDNFDNITQSFAEELLKKDVVIAENIINKAIKIKLNQNQFDALVIFAYNTGRDKSDLYGLINNNADPESIVRWWNTHYIQDSLGVKLNGLIKRRAFESHLFVTPPTDLGSNVKSFLLPGISILIILGIILKK
jgi:lysozyme